MRAWMGGPVVVLACVIGLSPGATAVSAEVDMAAATRALQIVPCLLPARIRRLGNMTYPERRKLVETTAKKCELRGGEYTFYDRAQPESAAKFFQKLADDGDTDAQASLGDVYQYLFTPPRYDESIRWYAMAAEGGNKSAKMQLARLYERGLGTEQDGLKAVNLWREATGTGEELVLASELEAARTEADARIARLTQQLQQRSEEAERTRQLLAAARSEIGSRKSQLAQAERNLDALRGKLTAAAQGDPQELARLRQQISTQQQTIDDQLFQIETLEGDADVQEAQLTASLRRVEAQNARLQQELDRVDAESDTQVAEALEQLAEKDAQLAALSSELASARAALDGAGDSERQVAQQQSRIGELEAQLASVSSEAERLRGELSTQINETSQAQADFASSEAELAKVRLELDRRTQQVADANQQLADLEAQRVATEQSLAASEQADRAQLERRLASQSTKVREQRATIAGLEAELDEYRAQIQEINIRRASYATRSPIEDTSKIRLPRNVKVGRYHALVIGNNEYDHLTDLQNAHSDAQAVHDMLKEEYGFRSKLLLDASRLEMFQGIAALGELTGPDDLVLIYYAGHGYRLGDQSYWLPVEVRSRADAPGAGLSSEEVANWIKNIPARHVMIVADSCYSGAGIETTGGFKYSADDLEMMLPFLIRSRSRTMLTSGGDGPVMDGGGADEHSVFTRELLGLLKENTGVLHGEQMYSYLVERVKYTVDGDAINQTPTFGSIERAGHESGQFVFLRKKVRS